MKALYLIALLFAGIGLLLVFVGTFSALYEVDIIPTSTNANFFHAANSYFLMTIILFIFVFRNDRRKE